MLFQQNRIIKYLFLFVFSVIKTAESQNNTPYTWEELQQPFLREFPPDPFYPNGEGKMLKTPTDSLDGSMVKCADPLPKGTYPLPRCISNEFAYNLGPSLNINNIEQQSKLRSKRKTSHMATWFGHYISFDISLSKISGQALTSIYIPADDATFNPPSSIPGELSANGITSLPFNLSDTLDNRDPLNSARNGVNLATPSLDLSTIYGTSDNQSLTLRNGCKLLTSNDDGKFPPKDAEGNYIKGAPSRSWTLFTLAITTVWIREHNRLCDLHQQDFEEAKRWNIAFYQKTASEEYLGTILGRPLPLYKGYNPNLVPGIDTFFNTVTFRYGHTELSDTYRIQDEYGDTIADLTLDQTRNQSLVETYGLNRVLSSMALQRQEEADIFFSDATRNIVIANGSIYDLPAFDVARSRDRGIALYNVVREAYELPRKNTWADVTSNKYIQDRLQLLYPNGPDTAEAYVGAFCEDHLDSSNFGELLEKSIVTQFNRIRETDKLWWESPERFNEAEQKELRDTTFREIIARNLGIDGVDSSQFVGSIWTVQPHSESESSVDVEYSSNLSPWTSYSIKYRLDGTHIYFKVELQTAGGEGWFGMGFDPSDNGMKDAQFIIGIVKNNDIELSNYHAAEAGYHPPIKQDPVSDSDIKSKRVSSGGKTMIEFRRLLTPSNRDRKPIRRGDMKYIMAYSPTNSGFSYHGSDNRHMKLVDFYSNEVSAANLSEELKKTHGLHGIGMFLTWCLLFPISIFIVRFRKHTNNYLKIHRTMQLLGGISISSFGAAAIAATTKNRTSHALMGLTIYSLVFVELGLGLISFWGQASVVSVNHGYPRFTKRTHKVFGYILLLSAWINIYLGIDAFVQTYGSDPKVLIILKVIYGLWMFTLIIIFCAGEYWRRRKGSFNKLHSTEASVELEDKRKSMLYSNKNYDNLPLFTWEDVNEHVQRGAFWVVCDGLVVDVRKWARVHPGGAKILEKVAGTDITNDFHNTHKKMDIVDDVETPETQLLSNGDNIHGKLSKNFITIIKNQNVAKMVDKINIKYFSNAPLATHEHSAFAIRKMLDLVIGKIDEEQESIENEHEEEMMTKRIQFRRFKLTSKSIVNNNEKYPVVKFTFTKVYQDEDMWDEIFLPGYYIEVKSRVKGQTIVRSYTPIEGKLSKSFSIYVKVYPNGLMSTHLNEQLIGFEIQVHGPFDVSERSNLLSNARSSLFVPRSSRLAEKSSLLNQNSLDGCWKELFMICGGTGITPMLQLIKYHLFQSDYIGKKDRGIHMRLLYGNKSIEDVIDCKKLREYELSSRGMLKISYVFSETISGPISEPFPEGYLQGRITSDIVKRWLSDNKATTSPASSIYQHEHEHSQFKIVVCGPVDMMTTVDQTLVEMGYSKKDYVLLE